MTMADTVYVVSLFAALGVICPPLTEATGPSNPVPWPVRLGGTAYLLCYPLHSELSSVREALWSVYNPKHDNWTSILGIDRSNSQANCSWHIKSFANDSRYTLYGPNHIFLKLGKVTEEDIGTECRCSVSTWESVDLKPEGMHYILILLDDSKEASPPTIPLATTTTWSASPPTTLPARTTTWPVDGQWSNWGTWSGCTKTCGHGISTRERMCGNSHPAFGGVTCDGKPFEAQVCVVQACPVDGQWSNWGTWSSCTKTCGHGISTRERMCGNSHPAFGGVTCDGKPFEAEVCLVQTCPGHSSSNKAWKIGCLVLALLLASAIVVIIYMCYKCCKVPVTHAPQGDAVNNRNGIFYRNHKYWTEGQHHNDEDDDEMLNI